jgi:hypothetical protein
MAWSFESPVTDLCLRPRGLQPEAEYRVRQVLPGLGEDVGRTGRELTEDGYPISLAPRSAAFLLLDRT